MGINRHYMEKEAEMAELTRVTTPFSYSQAVVAGDFVFLGLHRGGGANLAAQLDDIFTQLENTLTKCGVTLADLVKVNVWLKHINDLPEMERRFHDLFEKDKFPARMTSTTEFIDDDCLIMIDGVAYQS